MMGTLETRLWGSLLISQGCKGEGFRNLAGYLIFLHLHFGDEASEYVKCFRGSIYLLAVVLNHTLSMN